MTLPSIGDGEQIGDGNTAEQLNIGRGTQPVRVGGSSSSTLGFFGGTAVTRPANTLTTADVSALTTSAVCAMTTAQLQTLQTTVNGLVLDLRALGLVS